MTAILVTRPGGETDPVVGYLKAIGYRVYAVPMVLTHRLEFGPPDVTRYDWVVVTSAAGVDALGEVAEGARWAAVGQATAQALRARGVEPALVPTSANGLALANALPDVGGKRVLLVRGAAAAADLPTRLRERGAAVEELAVYATIEGPASAALPLREALADVDLAAIVFASGSAVRGYIALGGTTSWPAITIGPRTTDVVREFGFQVIAEAEGQSAEALAAVVVGVIPVGETNSA
ncbi:MAG TPA: uroporphyrinogen-III synthase [Candidatus Dormibacteraeota bacterium]|nr:uroporphyrinogen-III synthase [Candidatus Dormibacteraeota bacterium]